MICWQTSCMRQHFEQTSSMASAEKRWVVCLPMFPIQHRQKGSRRISLLPSPKVNIQIMITTSFLAPRAQGILYSTTTLHSSCSWFGLAASSVNAMCLVLHVSLLVRCGPTAALQLRLLRCRHAQPGGFCWEEAYNNN